MKSNYKRIFIEKLILKLIANITWLFKHDKNEKQITII